MPIRKFNPVTPGRRQMTVLTFDEITTDTPHAPLTEKLQPSGGRSSTGEQTIWWRGGGHKRAYRVIDFKRDKAGIPAKVATVEYDPNRSSRIALITYPDGEKRYILQPAGIKVGDTVVSGDAVDILPGNCLPLKNIPLGTQIHNVELRPGKGGQIARSAGSSVQLVARRRLRLRQDALGRDPEDQRRVCRDDRPGRQSRSRERVDRQGRTQPVAGQAAARARCGDESGGPPARWW